MNKSLIILAVFLIFSACKQKTSDETTYVKYKGETMGTTYHITVNDSASLLSKSAIDSTLKRINSEVSTYISSSIISRFNRSDTIFCTEDSLEHFNENFFLAKNVYRRSEGFYDPTVMPLVNYWGFGYKGRVKRTDVDSQEVESILKYTGFDKVKLISSTEKGKCYKKADKRMELDFSASAKGYAVDVLAEYLNDKRIQDFFVEIGGEVRVKGKNKDGKIWTVGINIPSGSSSRDAVFQQIPLNNNSIATSGNYRNFYRQNGKIISHTINPKTGYAQPKNILSASVFHDRCGIADAFATASMSMGLRSALQMMKNNKLKYYFIAAEEDSLNTYTNIQNLKKE